MAPVAHPIRHSYSVHLEKFQIENFRSFVTTPQVALDSINVFIGPNNAGKSSVLRALSVLQQPSQFVPDIRVGERECKVLLGLRNLQSFQPWSGLDIRDATLEALIKAEPGFNLTLTAMNGRRVDVSPLSPIEPNHFVVPYLSKRKASTYVEDVREQNAMAVGPDFTTLLQNSHDWGTRVFLGTVATSTPATRF